MATHVFDQRGLVDALKLVELKNSSAEGWTPYTGGDLLEVVDEVEESYGEGEFTNAATSTITSITALAELVGVDLFAEGAKSAVTVLVENGAPKNAAMPKIARDGAAAQPRRHGQDIQRHGRLLRQDGGQRGAVCALQRLLAQLWPRRAARDHRLHRHGAAQVQLWLSAPHGGYRIPIRRGFLFALDVCD